jgi:putative DNA methylase
MPFSLKDAPALIERLLPVQKLSAEVYKERMAGTAQTLTALGNFWKGRKPLILNKACILGCLLPATDDPARDLEIFEKLLAMDDESFVVRWKRRPKPKEILATLSISKISDYFTVEPEGILPAFAPVDWSRPEYDTVNVAWREDLSELPRRRLESQMLPRVPYHERVDQANRPEEVMDAVYDHIWDAVNAHLGTNAHSFPELVEQVGVMRFGHRPRVADTFCGSGQIPFEAARLGCDVYASDLNPVACMLTWGAFNIVGGSVESRKKLAKSQQELLRQVQAEIDNLGIESDGKGWRAKVFLYCMEVRCPQSGWMVPLLPTLIVSKGYRVIAELVPDIKKKRYDIIIRSAATDQEMAEATHGTVIREGRFADAYLMHQVNGVSYKTKLSTLRGDYQKPDGTIGNRVRLWGIRDFRPRSDDIFQERLYCVQWMRPKKKGNGDDYEFRTVTPEDMERERTVEAFIERHLAEWQNKGWVPDMRIEPGGPPRYQGLDLIRARGWTYWNNVFNSRQLLIAGLLGKFSDARGKFGLARVLDYSSKLSRWGNSFSKGCGNTVQTFYNQALNTLWNYGCRSTGGCSSLFRTDFKSFPFDVKVSAVLNAHPAVDLRISADIFVTDPPYGDAVKYEEILDFFIAWLRKNPPQEFSDWVWDSRRSLAIKGDVEDFRRNMVSAYKRMTKCMPDNGIQVIMFTHQSESIWADMANIVWASGLQVTAAWYVATETDSALREGSHVKGTVLLVLRKRQGMLKTTRDELAWDIQDEVQEQVRTLTGLNQKARGLYRDENVFEDSDLQMAGYAAALRVLTRYAIIDGRDMTVEAIRPRVKGEPTFVDELIIFAVDTANECLVPQGLAEKHWKEFTGAERFYLKLIDLESKGLKTLDNYQNFAKAFKVRDFRAFMGSQKANHARLKSAVEFGRTEMSEGAELHQSVLRAVLYAMMELVNDIDGAEVLAHLTFNVSDYYGNATQRERVVEVADYLAKKLETARPEEASAARILRELVKNQRLG